MSIYMAKFVAVVEIRSGSVVGSSDDSCRSPEVEVKKGTGC